jgi:hypothetical protein
MSDGLLLAAALLLVVTAAVHSVVGERRLIGPVLARHDGILKSPSPASSSASPGTSPAWPGWSSP